MRRGGRFSALLVSAAMVAGILFALSAISTVLLGDTWWWHSALLLSTVSIAALVTRALTRSRAAGFAAAGIAWMWLGLALVAPDTSWWGLPTVESITVVHERVVQAIQEILGQGTPAAESPALIAIIVLGAGLSGVFADAVVFGWRMPALYGLVPAALFVTPTLIEPQPVNVGLFVLLAGCFLIVLWLGPRRGELVPSSAPRSESRLVRTRTRNPVTAIIAGVCAVIVAVALPAVTPGLTEASFADTAPHPVAPSIYSAGVDPTIQLGADLHRPQPLVSLTYATTSATALYLKLLNLTEFGEREWGIESQYAAEGLKDELGTPPGLSDEVARQEIVTTVTIESLRSDWLPMPYPARAVEDAEGDWLYSPETLTVTSFEDDTRGGFSYTVRSLQVSPTAAQLAESGTTVPDRLRRMLRTPDSLPETVEQTALAVTAGRQSNYDKAVALQQYFTSGEFRYSLTAPSEFGYDSSNMLAMAMFLEQKAGYCVHFATTMAMMARVVGIPARIAIGFHGSGPAATPIEGVARHEVLTDDLHAWPELYFDGIGWLPFEPTPSLGLQLPDYSLPSYATAPVTQGPGEVTDLVAEAGGEVLLDLGGGAEGPTAADVAAQQFWSTFTVATTVGIVLTVLAFAPFTLRRVRRRRRLRTLRRCRTPAAVVWDELYDSANDYGVTLAPSATAREDAARLTRAVPGETLALDRLCTAYERETYARPSADSSPSHDHVRTLLRDLDSVQRALSRTTDGWGRVRARFLPVSLLTRRRSVAGTT